MELPVREPGAPTWSHVAKHGRKVRRLEMIRDRELKAGWGWDDHLWGVFDMPKPFKYSRLVETCIFTFVHIDFYINIQIFTHINLRTWAHINNRYVCCNIHMIYWERDHHGEWGKWCSSAASKKMCYNFTTKLTIRSIRPSKDDRWKMAGTAEDRSTTAGSGTSRGSQEAGVSIEYLEELIWWISFQIFSTFQSKFWPSKKCAQYVFHYLQIWEL